MSLRRLLGASALALIAALAIAPRAASAQPVIADGTAPEPGQTVQPPGPSELLMVFSEPLPEPPRAVLQDSANATVALGVVARGDDDQTWIFPITGTLGVDVYKVTWTVADISSGTYQFTIAGATTETTAATGTTAAGSATTATASGTSTTDAASSGDGSEVSGTGATASAEGDEGLAKALAALARWASYLSLGAFAGGLLLIVVAWPEGVEYVLTARHLRVSWAIALISTLVLVICTRAIDTGSSLGSSLSPGSWRDLTETRPGVALLARLILVAACGWVAFRPERIIDPATQIPAFAAPILALATLGFSREGDTSLGFLAIPAGIAHALSYAAWFGGIVLLARVVLAGPGEEDLVHALRGFARIAAPALIVVVASGALQTARLVGGASKLLTTGYGRLLLVKTVAVAAMAYIGTINRHTVAHRMARLDHLPARAASRLRRAIGSEVTVGVVVLGLSAWMMGSIPSGLTPPGEDNSVAPVVTVPMTQTGVRVSVGIGPAEVGPNSITINVVEPAVGLVEMTVQLDPADGSVASIVIPVPLASRGVWVVNEVPLDAPGLWTIAVTSRSTDGQLPNLSGSFTVTGTSATDSGDDGGGDDGGDDGTGATTTIGTGLGG